MNFESQQTQESENTSLGGLDSETLDQKIREYEECKDLALSKVLEMERGELIDAEEMDMILDKRLDECAEWFGENESTPFDTLDTQQEWDGPVPPNRPDGLNTSDIDRDSDILETSPWEDNHRSPWEDNHRSPWEDNHRSPWEDDGGSGTSGGNRVSGDSGI